MTRTVFFAIVLLMASTVAPLWAADFDHQAHVEEYAADADCSTCHVEGAKSIVPQKSVCAECHDAEMIADVSLPATKTHGPVWPLNHSEQAKGVSANCASCHEQDFCLECHASGFANEQGDFSNNMINVHRSDFSVSHPIAARADMQRCNACHEPRFCDECHETWRFRSGDIGSPSHRRTFDLGIANADIDVIHQGLSLSNNTLTCDTCHAGASMDFHSWSIGHAREARRSLATCQACHPDGDTCLKCHSAKGGVIGFNPHPKNWDDIKGNLEDASNGRTCRRCH